MTTLTNASVFVWLLSIEPLYMYVRGISRQVTNKLEHRELMKVNCPQIIGKRYFCSIKFNNFLFSGFNFEPKRI